MQTYGASNSKEESGIAHLASFPRQLQLPRSMSGVGNKMILCGLSPAISLPLAHNINLNGASLTSAHWPVCTGHITHFHTSTNVLFLGWLLVMTLFIILPRECVLYVWVVTVQPGHGPRNQLAIPANTSSPHTTQYWITNIYCL